MSTSTASRGARATIVRARAAVPPGANFRRYMSRLLRALILSIAVAAVLLPLAYLVLNSVKLPREFLTTPPTIIPSIITLEHFAAVFEDASFIHIFANTLVVSLSTTLISVAIGTLAAYGLARMGLPPVVMACVLFVFLFIRFFPRVTTVIPFFLVVRSLGLLDSIWAIVLGHLGITVAFVAWLMLIVFRALPFELEEAAMVDGASIRQRFWHVAVPLAAPGIVTSAIFTAFFSWNEFLIASSVSRMQGAVLSMTVASFVTDKGIYWGPMAATSLVMIAPMIAFAFLVQRFLVRGLTLGAVKG
jgi:multiple sugar transport system permease protein